MGYSVKHRVRKIQEKRFSERFKLIVLIVHGHHLALFMAGQLAQARDTIFAQAKAISQ